MSRLSGTGVTAQGVPFMVAAAGLTRSFGHGAAQVQALRDLADAVLRLADGLITMG